MYDELSRCFLSYICSSNVAEPFWRGRGVSFFHSNWVTMYCTYVGEYVHDKADLSYSR